MNNKKYYNKDNIYINLFLEEEILSLKKKNILNKELITRLR